MLSGTGQVLGEGMRVIIRGIPASLLVALWGILGSASAALVAEYNFEEAGGTTAVDSASGLYNGTLVNGPTRVSGRVGNTALHFDGIDDYVDLGTDVNLLRKTSGRTVLAWVRVPTLTRLDRPIFAV